MAEKEHCEVLIVGAGPSGLLAACELKRRGIDCRVIDKNPHRSEHSKALAIHAPTLEILDLMGLASEFTRRGYPITEVNLNFEGNIPVEVELSQLDTRFPYVLSLPQGNTEEILENYLLDLGGQVMRNTELIDFKPVVDGVEVSLKQNDNAEVQIHCDYLLDCEGAHSAIRHKLGLAFEGKAYEFTAFLADVKLEGQAKSGRINIFTSAHGGLFVLALPDGNWRVISIDFTRQHQTGNDALSLDELQESVDLLSPTKLTLSDPRWLTRFGSPYRIVPSFRADRVFLAGDAAHVHSPAGGQGMNMGLQDVFNLAWKLSMVIKGDAPATLLDSYNQERHMVDSQIMHMTDFLLKNFLLQNAFLRALRNRVVGVLAHFKPLQKIVGYNLTGLRFDYQTTRKSWWQNFRGISRLQNRSFSSSTFDSGKRISDLELFSATQPSVRLYDWLRGNNNYTLFAYLTSSIKKVELEHLITLLEKVQSSTGGVVRACLVLPEAFPELRDSTFPILIDFKKQFRYKTGAEPGNLLLIRPDAHLAFRLAGFEETELQQALQPWVCLSK